MSEQGAPSLELHAVLFSGTADQVSGSSGQSPAHGYLPRGLELEYGTSRNNLQKVFSRLDIRLDSRKIRNVSVLPTSTRARIHTHTYIRIYTYTIGILILFLKFIFKKKFLKVNF